MPEMVIDCMNDFTSTATSNQLVGVTNPKTSPSASEMLPSCCSIDTARSDNDTAIRSAKSVKALGVLYYKWVAKFPKGTKEYEALNKVSGDMKLKLNNPEMGVEVR